MPTKRLTSVTTLLVGLTRPRLLPGEIDEYHGGGVIGGQCRSLPRHRRPTYDSNPSITVPVAPATGRPKQEPGFEEARCSSHPGLEALRSAVIHPVGIQSAIWALPTYSMPDPTLAVNSRPGDY